MARRVRLFSPIGVAIAVALAACSQDEAADAESGSEGVSTAQHAGSAQPSAAAILAQRASSRVGRFSFFEVRSVDEMKDLLRDRFGKGTPRADVRRAMVEEGGARLIAHPEDAGVEKYVFDINLCRLYVFRWNISADFDADDRLAQIFVNGLGVIPGGRTTRTRAPGTRTGQTPIQGYIPHPEADLGEPAVTFEGFDRDQDTATTLDQVVDVKTPSRADPFDFGKVYVYARVERWRSVVDRAYQDGPAEWPGDCPPAAEEPSANE